MDLVVTVPKDRWIDWLAEGDCAGIPGSGREYEFSVWSRPPIQRGERLYIVAHGKLRGYALVTTVSGPLTPDLGLFTWLASSLVATGNREGVSFVEKNVNHRPLKQSTFRFPIGGLDLCVTIWQMITYEKAICSGS